MLADLLSFLSFFNMNINENTHTHRNMHNCCPFSAILVFFTLSLLLFCIFPRDKQLSVLPKMLLHIIGLLMGCIVAIKKKESHSSGKKEPSSANGLNLSQMSQLSQQTWQGAATTTHFTCQQRVYWHMEGRRRFHGWVAHSSGNHFAR